MTQTKIKLAGGPLDGLTLSADGDDLAVDEITIGVASLSDDKQRTTNHHRYEFAQYVDGDVVPMVFVDTLISQANNNA